MSVCCSLALLLKKESNSGSLKKEVYTDALGPHREVWTLSSSPIPRLGCLFSFFLAHWHEMKKRSKDI